MKIYALVDCNSFYASCERVFHPETRGKPIIVLSNNDGCGISYSKEAKEIGFGVYFEPFFKMKDKMREHNVAVFSSNYALYDNMSNRVMNLLRDFAPQIEVYSVDEAFLDLKGFHHVDLLDYGHKIRREVLRQTGIPVGVGIAPTKVLSKIANKLSKQHDGVLVMLDEATIDRVLKTVPVQKVWGIGKQSAIKLMSLGIQTAYDFKVFDNDALIQKMFTKIGREVQDELRGINCLETDELEDKRHTGASTLR